MLSGYASQQRLSVQATERALFLSITVVWLFVFPFSSFFVCVGWFLPYNDAVRRCGMIYAGRGDVPLPPPFQGRS